MRIFHLKEPWPKRQRLRAMLMTGQLTRCGMLRLVPIKLLPAQIFLVMHLSVDLMSLHLMPRPGQHSFTTPQIQDGNFMPAGTVVASGVLVSPGGQQGIPGPNALSTDVGNQATFGSDAKIYVPDPSPVIWSVRLRSFQAIGNPNFEIDQ